MKRVIVLLAFMMIVPSVIFAQLYIGPAVFLKSPVLLGQEIDIEEHNVNQFSFGGDVGIVTLSLGAGPNFTNNFNVRGSSGLLGAHVLFQM